MPNPLAAYGQYLTAGLQMAVSLLLGIFLGYFGDRKWDTLPWLTLIGTVIGFLLGLYQLMRQIGIKKENQ